VGFDLDQPTGQLCAITLGSAMAMIEPPCHGQGWRKVVNSFALARLKE